MVCLMSRTAKRPRGGKSEKASTHMGLDGTNTTMNLFLDFVELASNMSGVAIQHRRVAVTNLTRMVQDNDLSGEVLGGECRLVLGIGCDVSTLDVLNGDVLDVEANIVSGNGLGEGFVMHFNRFDFSGQHVGSKSDDHTRLDDTSLDTTNGHCSNTANFVDILERQSQRLVGRSCWRNDGIQTFQKSGSLGSTFLTGDFPSLVPGHVLRG